METLITKKLKVSKMHKIFDAQHDNFMVKYFKPKNNNISEKIEMDDIINFEILIRHNDEMDAKTLFNNALDPKKVNKCYLCKETEQQATNLFIEGNRYICDNCLINR